jgi:hypothetical protein
MSIVTIDAALANPQLLGAALGDLGTWSIWIATLKAAHGLPLDEAEVDRFRMVAGERSPPGRKVKELVAVASRRSGKGRMGAALAVHAALLTDSTSVLAPGERGVVGIVSPTRAQAGIMVDYCTGYLEASPLLKGEVELATSDEIRLRNGNVITVLTSDYRSLRGRTLLLALLDEASFLRSEDSTISDIEAARALMPGLATTGGMLAILSSPYRRAGLLFERHRDYFGCDSDDVLVVAGDSRTFNPTLSAEVISSAIAADSEAALSEWQGEFRRDLSSFLADDVIEQAIERDRPLELEPRRGIKHVAFVDLSGGRHDASVICIGHAERGRFIADVVRGRAAPHDPGEVCAEYAGLLRDFGLKAVIGDAYSAEWPVRAFASCGVDYIRAGKPKSQIYLESLPYWNRALISIPDVPKLSKELRLLERRTHRGGRDSVDHPPNASDDYANALCGAAWLALQPRKPNVGGLAAQVREADEAYQARERASWGRDKDGNPIGIPTTLTPEDFGLTEEEEAEQVERIERRLARWKRPAEPASKYLWKPGMWIANGPTQEMLRRQEAENPSRASAPWTVGE